MTLVMAWREGTYDRIWMVSDSRLSYSGAQGNVRLTDAAAKLLSAPVVLRRQTPLSVLGTPVLTTNLAFAYAGSSLVAMQAYAAVLPLWSHLQTSGPERFPSVHDFAKHLGTFVGTYWGHVSSAYNASQSVQCALIGFDATLGTIDGWMIETGRCSDETGPKLRRMDLAQGDIEIFGNGSKQARGELNGLRSEGNPLWHREPLEMIRRHLNGEPEADVGGGVQLGYISREGFQLLFDAQPVAPGHQIPIMRFRGFDFSDIRTVGDAFVNLPGMI